MSDQWVDAWLGAARFDRYVAACDGDRARALKLYEWNSELAQALMRDIGHFEVALRNAYDATLTAHWRQGGHWLLHPESPVVTPIWRTKVIQGMKRGTDVNSLTRKNVDDAIRRCGYAKARPGKVIAELTFGFWRQLTTKAMEKTMWVPYLHHAFPAGTSRSQVDAVVAAVNTVRNRIAHHEPLIGLAPSALDIHSDMMALLSDLAVEVSLHVGRTSSVARVYSQRP